MAFATITTTAGAEKVSCEPGQSVDCAFTATNTSGRPVRISLQGVVEEATPRGWVKVTGAPERDLPDAGSDHVTVRVSVPADATPGTYPFRLRAYETDDPEQSAKSPAVAVEVSAAKVAPPILEPVKKPFPWLIVVAIAVAVLVVGGGVVAWLFVAGAPPENLQGSWVNKDPNTGSVTKLDIKIQNKQLSAHAWGACSPEDCDWGSAQGGVDETGTMGVVRWDQGFAIKGMRLLLEGNELTVQLTSMYKDERPTRNSTEHFVRR